MTVNKWIPKLSKASIALAFLGLAAAGMVWFMLKKNEDPKPKILTIAGKTQTRGEFTTKDSDQDGLKDWEEIIYGTNPNNPDTDGDNTIDGDEIVLNRNPLVSGPDDQVKIDNLEQIADSEDLIRNLGDRNLTQTLVHRILGTRGIDAFIDPKQAGATSAELLIYLNQLKNTPKFTENSVPNEIIKITQDTSPESIRQYFNQIALVYNKHIFALEKDDLEIVLTSIDKEDKKYIGELDKLVTAVNNLLMDLKQVPIPLPVVTLHKKEIFLAQKTVDDIKLLKEINLEDSLYLATLLNMRLELKKAVGDFHRKEIPDWITQKNVSFASDDYARMLYPIP